MVTIAMKDWEGNLNSTTKALYHVKIYGTCRGMRTKYNNTYYVYINILTRLKSSVFPESQRPNNSTVSPDFLLLIIASNTTKRKLDIYLKTVWKVSSFKIQNSNWISKQLDVTNVTAFLFFHFIGFHTLF